MKAAHFKSFPEFGFDYKKTHVNSNRTKYIISEGGILVHESTVFNRLFLLRLIDEKGPAIGDCYTNEHYRGRSIYPSMLNKLAEELLIAQRHKEIFVVVDHDNTSSIRGIEKAGFKLHSKIETNRYLFFYLNIKVIN